MVYFITHTEPSSTLKGNLVKFYVRHFDEETLNGRSLPVFEVPVDLVVPSFEMPREESQTRIESLRKKNPGFGFQPRRFDEDEDIIWAILPDKEKRHDLPKGFLSKKTSPSQLLRWLFPPFLIVNFKDKNKKELVLPSLEEIVEQRLLEYTNPKIVDELYVNPGLLINEKCCAVDIETTGWMHPDEEERITAVVLNSSSGMKRIVTAFGKDVKNFRDYQVFYKKNTDGIKKAVAFFLQQEDPLFLYLFNGSFDLSKLRDLGKEEFRPAVDFSHPVYKSVQAIKNMIVKGRWGIEMYGYVFLYRHLLKNNKLETHAKQKKTLNHVELELLTKKALAGSKEARMQLLTYIADDGDITSRFGNELLPLILPKAHFTRREPSTICTAGGLSIMREFWQKKYFFQRNTLHNRFGRGKPEEIGFDPETKKDEALGLPESCFVPKTTTNGVSYVKPSGFCENAHLFLPAFFIRAAYGMIRGTDKNLSLNSPEERLNYVQTLNGYISHALEEYYLYAEQKRKGEFSGLIRRGSKGIKFEKLNKEFEELYGIDLRTLNEELAKIISEMDEALRKAEVITFSKKFIYVKEPEPLITSTDEDGKIIKHGFGFIYGHGPTVYAEDKIVSLVRHELIFQGFGLTGEGTPDFLKDVIEGAIWARLNGLGGCYINDIINQQFSQIPILPRRKLVFSHTEERANKKAGKEGIKYHAGALEGRGIVSEAEFLESTRKPDFIWYKRSFEERFEDILEVLRGPDHIHRARQTKLPFKS